MTAQRSLSDLTDGEIQALRTAILAGAPVSAVEANLVTGTHRVIVDDVAIGFLDVADDGCTDAFLYLDGGSCSVDYDFPGVTTGTVAVADEFVIHHSPKTAR